MKRNKIILGSVGLVAIAALAMTSFIGKGEATYKKDSLSTLQPQSGNPALEWLNARYIDVATGEKVTPEVLASIKRQMKKKAMLKSLSFIEVGPDNIGGRTRAICIDRNYDNRIWAGGVSGGLWVTYNSANYWSRVDSYPGSPYISSIAQTRDGKLFVATGNFWDFGSADGVWMSSDNGNTWSIVPGTESFSFVNEVVTDNVNNVVWMATSAGLKKYDNATATLSDVSIGASGQVVSLQISKDGSVLVCSNSTNKTYVSNDNGATWTAKFGSTAGNVPTTAPRIEYAISATKNEFNNYTLYAVRTSSNLVGMSVSTDNGNTWYEFVGASSTGGPLDIYRDQGTYNSIVSVVPTNTEKIMIGGIDIWSWEQTVSSPPSGGFNKLTNWFSAPWMPQYVHADNHEMKWDSNHRLYIGNDGGIGKTEDLVNYWPANRGYNVTQFYYIAYDKNGAVIGGTQDNGTLYNDHSLSTWQEFKEVNGGDGFACEISFFNPSVMFSSVYYNSLARSGDAGESFTSFIPPLPGSYTPIGSEGGNHPFVTSVFMAEYLDLNSKDSVNYIPTRAYGVGETIIVPSAATGDSMVYITTSTVDFDDTVYYDPALTTQDVIVTGERFNETATEPGIEVGQFNLSIFSWSHTAGSPSQANPPEVGDSLLINFGAAVDTIYISAVSFQDHYYGQNPSTGEQVDMGTQTEIYNVAWDTLRVQDPYQSWLVMYVNANGGELWATRDAMRLSKLTPVWQKIAVGIGSDFAGSNQSIRVDVEFSKDMEQCYVVAGNGVWRIDGLGSNYSDDAKFKTNVGYGLANTTATALVPGVTYRIVSTGSSDFTLAGAATNTIGTEFVATGTTAGSGTALQIPGNTSATKISTLVCEGIALNPSNPDDLMLFQGFGGQIRRSSNASTAGTSGLSLSSLANIASPNPAVYDGIIDRNNPDVIVLGTSNGAWVSEDGGSTWLNASAGFEDVPVFHVRQSWRTYAEGNNRDGEIYIGTYGRGIWASESYLGIKDESGLSNEEKNFKLNLKTFPNPTVNQTTLAYNLNAVSDVTVSVYDITGSLVKQIKKSNVAKGQNTVDINVEGMRSGTYIVKFNAGSLNGTTKFIKM